MPYIEFKSVVKKVNLKPGGKKEIVLEISDNGLNGKLDNLSEMIDCKVDVSLESLVMNYNITINTKTNKPLKSYKVDDKGVVSEIKQEGEQLEADLGLPPEEIPTKEQTEWAELKDIDDFITSGMAPRYDDLPYDFESIVQRKYEGETYMKMASELGISSGKIVELVDEYRKRVAPLAIKWNEWRKGQENTDLAKDTKPTEANEPESKVTDEIESKDTGDIEEDQSESNDNSQDSEVNKTQATTTKEQVEEFILSGQAPLFEEIPYDFPTLFKRKQEGETWLQIANSMGETSSKITGAWTKYKKLITEHLKKTNGDGQGAA